MMQQITSHLEHACSLWDWPIYNSYDVPQAWKEHGISFLHALKAFRDFFFLGMVGFFFKLTLFLYFPSQACIYFFLWSEYRLSLSRFIWWQKKSFYRNCFSCVDGNSVDIKLTFWMWNLFLSPTLYFLCMFTFRASSVNSTAWQMQISALSSSLATALLKANDYWTESLSPKAAFILPIS